eukprot:946605-Pyramimonas_sp.AAC.2
MAEAEGILNPNSSVAAMRGTIALVDRSLHDEHLVMDAEHRIVAVIPQLQSKKSKDVCSALEKILQWSISAEDYLQAPSAFDFVMAIIKALQVSTPSPLVRPYSITCWEARLVGK